MHPDARRQVARVLAEIEEARSGDSLGDYPPS
jgi:hypothetical protein